MAKGFALFLDIEAITNDHLQTNPNPDGSDFRECQIIEPQAGLVRLDINLGGKAISELNPVFRLYRWEPEFKRYCRAGSFTLKEEEVITNTAAFEYRALETLEIGNHQQAIVLESAELGAALKAVWRRVSNGSV